MAIIGLCSRLLRSRSGGCSCLLWSRSGGIIFRDFTRCFSTGVPVPFTRTMTLDEFLKENPHVWCPKHDDYNEDPITRFGLDKFTNGKLREYNFARIKLLHMAVFKAVIQEVLRTYVSGKVRSDLSSGHNYLLTLRYELHSCTPIEVRCDLRVSLHQTCPDLLEFYSLLLEKLDRDCKLFPHELRNFFEKLKRFCDRRLECNLEELSWCVYELTTHPAFWSMKEKDCFFADLNRDFKFMYAPQSFLFSFGKVAPRIDYKYWIDNMPAHSPIRRIVVGKNKLKNLVVVSVSKSAMTKNAWDCFRGHRNIREHWFDHDNYLWYKNIFEEDDLAFTDRRFVDTYVTECYQSYGLELHERTSLARKKFHSQKCPSTIIGTNPVTKLEDLDDMMDHLWTGGGSCSLHSSSSKKTAPPPPAANQPPAAAAPPSPAAI